MKRLPIALLGLLAAGLQMSCAVLSVQAAVPPLQGTAWVQGAGPYPTISLSAQDQRLSGHVQCNRIMGSYALDGDRLRFVAVASTRRACIPDDGSEQAFLKALTEVRRWRIEGEELWLLPEGGAPLLRLRAAPAR